MTNANEQDLEILSNDREEELLQTSESARSTSPTEPDLTILVVTLLKGVIYQEVMPQMWASLLKLQTRLRDYVSIMGLELTLDEAEGYAFLRSRASADEDDTTTPHLVARRQLSFPVSLILALLRRRLAESDTKGGETRLVLSLDEVTEMVRIFFPAGTNDTKFVNQLETNLNKIIELGFLRKLKPTISGEDSYEVRRIIKAFVDAQWLSNLDEKLLKYEQYLAAIAGDSNDG